MKLVLTYNHGLVHSRLFIRPKRLRTIQAMIPINDTEMYTLQSSRCFNLTYIFPENKLKTHLLIVCFPGYFHVFVFRINLYVTVRHCQN